MCGCELPKAFSEKWRKARKEHKCCECHNKIKVGETYLFSSGVWDDPMSFKTCDSCVTIRSELSLPYECTPCFGELRDTIEQNSFCEGYGVSELMNDLEAPKWAIQKLFKEPDKCDA